MGKNFRNNKFSKDNEQKEFDDQIEGRNAVLELLESGKDILLKARSMVLLQR